MATDFGNTNLPFLRVDCAAAFGKEQGGRIFSATLKIYNELAAGAEFRGNAVIERHVMQKLLPAMSYYKALQSFGVEDALGYVRRETRKAAEINKQNNARFAKMPFVYAAYRMGVKKHMAKNFPPEGWQTEWVRCDGEEIHFNLHTCLYHEACMKNGCPELCAVYCENDDVSFSGLLPKIKFGRSGTLGGGAAYYDFHFIKAKK